MDSYIGKEAGGKIINRTKLIDGLLHCYHDKQLLQTVTPPDERDNNVTTDNQTTNRHRPASRMGGPT